MRIALYDDDDDDICDDLLGDPHSLLDVDSRLSSLLVVGSPK
jgi:hypothetical protein